MSGKRRSIEERVASLFGATAYRDIREGFGGTSPASLTAQDVAAALGWVAQLEGRIAPMVLETHYGSTLVHAQHLRRAWEDRERTPDDTRERIVLTRFGGELAIRQYAGVRYSTPQLAEYAYLIMSRRAALEARVEDATRWLDGIRERALSRLRNRLRETRDAA